ncbi:type I restriction endonuclease subunit R [Halomonas sp. FME1]|uniref:Type I restriction enzyme endonuclease subunit n=1 Tax=Halomonas casei TaxID=2742613 RepID=A0ABR9F1G7_9GAMM|nr:HsdR family type I site-specific deoxyribonuclease [Halomonas casei]MBE0400318.1 type I restriction endonuclease subunit R [Halomonas casei]
MGSEFQQSEQPLIDQLVAMGWTYCKGSLDDPAATGRESFAEVVQNKVLRAKLKVINTRKHADGSRSIWLNDERVSAAVSALTRIAAPGLMEANRVATELITEGFVVDGLPDWDGGRSRAIHYIDWDTPANNRFTVINQYKVKCPPGHDTAKQHIIPDLVLMVNGIPLVVIECKSPNLAEPMAEAIDQLRRYSDQRFANGEAGDHEGAPALFNTNQLLMATCFDDCRVGTIGAGASHYLPWKTVSSAQNPHQSETDVAKAFDVTKLSPQQRTVAGMLAPANLLDIVQHFTLFMTTGGQTIKLVCRYQQYRGVVKAIDRLRHGKTRSEDGEHDRRGGIIWHTQGSGKSLTMMFLVRRMRTDPSLRRFKIVVITDRIDLQKQLSATASLSGDLVHVANNSKALKKILRQEGPGLVFAMIQQYRDAESKAKVSDFDQLNTSQDILVMVDEAHRTQAGDLHANLQAGLPNCARIGFTGTPIIMGEKKRTHEIFGEFIDTYTIRESEADGATVPVLYEGRTVQGAVKDGSSLDELFEDFFADRPPEELEAIKQKYATKGNVLEATKLIEEKAQDMLRHYVTHILPNGFKAQVVGYSRLAAVRYKAAFEQARDQLLEEAHQLSPELKALDDEALLRKTPKLQARIQAWRYRELLARLEFATIVSGSNNDGSEWQPHTDRARQDEAIARFKKPLLASTEKYESKTDPLAFLIVKSMLLTGFDAPIEGVMYLDRSIQGAELLQTIARVNRTGFGKAVGIVVDYYGVANHLKEALAAYSDDDVDGALRSLKDEIPALRDRHLRAVDVLRSRGIEDLHDVEACVQALDSERVRQEFGVKLKAFMQSLDTVLPRPEALPFTADAKALAMIYAQARRRYRDSTVLGKDVGAKVRRLIDEHVISLGIDPKIAPVNLTDAQFSQQLNQVRDQAASYGLDNEESAKKVKKAVASEMEHAIRSQVSEKLDEDPVYYGKLSERLKEILDGLAGQWDALITALQAIIDEVNSGSTRHEEGLPDVPETYLPFYRMLREVKCGDTPPDLATQSDLIQLTEHLVEHISHEVKTSSFWEPHRRSMQEALEGELSELIYESELLELEQIEPLVDKLRDLAKANSYKLEQS